MYSWICSVLTLYYLVLFYFSIYYSVNEDDPSSEEEEKDDDDIDYIEEASNLTRPLKFIFVINLIHLLILALS